MVAWVRAARERDVDKMVSLYDPEVRGLLENPKACGSEP